MSAKRIKRKSKQTARYIPLDDIKIIDDVFLNEINNVRMKLSGCDDEKLINDFNEVLANGYKAAIELKALERKVDYDIKFAEIEARAAALRPWRRCWLWRLLFRPLTNRAQDIIEERAELDADKEHGAAEKAIKDEREELLQDSVEIKSKRELRRELKKQLKTVIKKADKTPTNEAFEESAGPKEPATEKNFSIDEIEQLLRARADDVQVKSFSEVWNVIKNRIYSPQDEQKPAESGEKQEAEQTDKPLKAVESTQPQPRETKQLPGQMTLDDVQPQVATRRPRPPRSCRKQ